MILPAGIRPAVPADLDAITPLHAEARATYYRGRIPDHLFDSAAEHARTGEGWARAVERGDVLCAVLPDGELAGVAAYRADGGGTVTLTQLHVAPARRRHGIGSALHSACLADWRRAGMSTARLEVYEHNERARAFYAARGWAPDPDGPRAGAHLVLTLRLSGE
ncbi:GNAT family N-acetyltransferase [Streptomyces sp. NBC_01619]|uniref:GNAT family N-acetyltransferase n=1 Tax=unclassified Streptomyces TaxID=2593676 RepID=UPI0022581373|nr:MULTISPECIES: GNAT family N-acetyltransferase [unclassified Streptomyces]MCX4509824.1 GNAT family N-acetyltransferase [Streptomyces sp. NBC_01619]